MRRFIPLFFFFFSLGLVMAGIYIGEPAAVWQKAVTICLSCIGIG